MSDRFGTMALLHKEIANMSNEQKRHCRIGKVKVKAPAVVPNIPPYRFDRPPMWPNPILPGVSPYVTPWWDRITCTNHNQG